MLHEFSCKYYDIELLTRNLFPQRQMFLRRSIAQLEHIAQDQYLAGRFHSAEVRHGRGHRRRICIVSIHYNGIGALFHDLRTVIVGLVSSDCLVGIGIVYSKMLPYRQCGTNVVEIVSSG